MTAKIRLNTGMFRRRAMKAVGFDSSTIPLAAALALLMPVRVPSHVGQQRRGR